MNKLIVSLLAHWSLELSSEGSSSLIDRFLFKDQGVAVPLPQPQVSITQVVVGMAGRGRKRSWAGTSDGWWGCPWRGHEVKTPPVPPVRPGPVFRAGV